MDEATSYQARFLGRWGHLADPHVRTLAWLLHAPDLLDVAAPQWAGKIATLGGVSPAAAAWLDRLDADPAPLHAHLSARQYTRLGLYAEKLMAFYFREQGTLVAHGVQVRASRNDTVGEFDFLLDAGPDGVEHIEFATKLYLLQDQQATRLDTFVGPNLADSLGRKMRKVMEHQLVLGQHPAAQAILPRPVVNARALVKGWLFYPVSAAGPAGVSVPAGCAGIAALHCRGFWCALADLGVIAGQCYVVLPRLEWLAPYRALTHQDVFDGPALQAHLASRFVAMPSPVLVASVAAVGGVLFETSRGFIVPDDWSERAAQRRQAPCVT